MLTEIELQLYYVAITTLCSKKASHHTHDSYFIKTSLILKILSLLERELNFHQK